VTPAKIRDLDLAEVMNRRREVVDIYREVYKEPPYNEGDDEADIFAGQLREHAHRPGFALVAATTSSDTLCGFAYGLTFAADRWWRNAGEEPTQTRGAAKFAVMEFAVRSHYRRQHIGSALMSTLLAGRPEPYATLCTNPDSLARIIYRTWGWRQVGVTHPEHLPPMDVLILPLPATQFSAM
jgi:ribosomal protein S18 acetylase RimI-like enzyme